MIERVGLIGLALLGPPAGWAGFVESLATPEFQVNTHVANDQRIPQLAASASGNVLIVWQSRNQDNPGWGIHGQHFDDEAEPLGFEFRLNGFNIGQQEGQQVSMRPDGHFVLVWHGPDRSADQTIIQQRRFGAGGQPLTGDQRVSDVVDNLQLLPRSALLAGDQMVVTWEGRGVTDGTFNILARAFEGSEPLGPVEQVNQHALSAQRRPDVAAWTGDPAGRHVVAWQSASQDGSDWGVFARCLTMAGSAGDEFLVNQTIHGGQSRPRVAMADDGTFAIAWQDNLGFSFFDYQRVMVRLFGPDCQPLGPELQVNQTDDGIQDLPEIDITGDGNFILVWQSYPSDFEQQGIYGRRLSASGQFLGDEFRISQEVEAYQDFPAVAGLPDGGFMVGWETAGQDGSGFGIYARRFFGPATTGLELVDGAGQMAGPGERFKRPLRVRVSDQWGGPRPGHPVVFRAAPEGPSALFANGSALFETVTDGNGQAVAEVFAGQLDGAHQVEITLPGADGLALQVELLNLPAETDPVTVPVLGRTGTWLLVFLTLLIPVLRTARSPKRSA